MSQLKQITADDRRRVLAFDWWVENADRSLTAHGGNPNLLWRAALKRLLVIDHNLAFDLDFDENSFFATHVFREETEMLFGDLVCRAETSAQLSAALENFDSAVNSLPPAWSWLDMEQTVPFELDLNTIKTRLALRAGLVRGLPS